MAEVVIVVRGKADTAEIERLKTAFAGVAETAGKIGDRVAPAAAAVSGSMRSLGGSVDQAASRFPNLASAAQSAMDRVKVGVKGATDAVNDMGAAIAKGGAVMSAGISAPIAMAAKTGIAFDDLKQRALIGFETMMGSADKAREHLAGLLDFARSTPFEAESLITASQRLQAMGIDAGAVMPVMAALGDNVAAVGGGAPLIDRLTLALGQMSAKGKLAGGEMRQFSEAGVPMLEMVAKKLGVTVAEAGKMIEDGVVSADVAMQAFVEGTADRFGGLGNMMERQSHTFSGLVSTLKDTVTQTLGSLFQPIFDQLSAGLERLNPMLLTFQGMWDRLDPSLRNAALAFVLVLAAVGPAAVAIGALMMVVSPVTFALLGLGLAAAFLAAAWAGDWFNIRDTVASAVQVVWGYIQSAIDFIGGLIGALDSVVPVGYIVAGVLGLIGLTIATTVISSLWGMATSAVASMATFAVSLLTGGVLSVASFVVSLGQAVVGTAVWAAQTAVHTAKVVASLALAAAGAVSGAATTVGANAATAASYLTTVVPSVLTTANTFLSTLIPSAIAAAQTFLTQTIPAAILTGVTFLTQTVPAAIVAAATFLTTLIPAAIAMAVTFITTTIPAAISTGVAFIGMAATAAMALAGMVVAAIGAGISIVIAFLPLILTVAAIGLAIYLLHKAWAENWGGIQQIAGKAVTWIREALAKGWQALIKGVSKLWESVSGLFKKGLTLLGDLWGRGLAWLADKAGGVFSAIAKGVREMMNKVMEFVYKGFEKAMDVFKRMYNALPQQLRDMIGWTVGAMSTGVSKITEGVDGIKSIFDEAKKSGEGLSGVLSRIGDKLGLKLPSLDELGGGKSGMPSADDLMASLGTAPDIAAAAGGAGGAGAKPSLEVGSTGRDSLGEFYIGEDGKKVYTSGAGLARQQAAERAAADRAAKKSGASSSASKAGAAAEPAAVTMANIAQRVSEAIAQGIESLKALSDAALPDEGKWRSKLALLETFISATLEVFDNLGRDLLAHIGPLKEDEQLLDTARAQAIGAAADLAQGTMDAVFKTSTFLQSIVKAKWPTGDQVDAAWAMISDMIGRIQARAIELSASFVPKDKDDDPTKILTAVGTALGGWADTFSKLVGVAGSLEQNSAALKNAAGRLVLVESMITEIGAFSGRIVKAVEKNRTPEQIADNLDLSKTIAGAFDAWADVVGKLSGAAYGLKDVARIPDGVYAKIEQFFSEIARITSVFVRGVQRSADSVEGRTERMDLSQNVAATFAAWIAPVADLAKTARALHDVARIPDGVYVGIERFFTEIARITGVFTSAIRRKGGTPEDWAASMALSRDVSSALGGAAEAVGKAAAALRSMEKLPDIPDAVVTRVAAMMGTIHRTIQGLLKGEGYDLTGDVQEATARQTLLGLVVKTLSDAVDVATKIGALGKQLAEAVPVDPRRFEYLAYMAMQAVWAIEDWAASWEKAVTDAGGYIDETVTRMTTFAGYLKDVVAAYDAFTGMALPAEVKPLDITAYGIMAENAEVVEGDVRRWSERWAAVITKAGRTLEEVRTETTAFAAQIKDAVDLFGAIADLTIVEATPFRADVLMTLIGRAGQVEEIVRGVAAAWAAKLRTAKVDIAALGEDVAAYVGQVKDALSLVADAADLAIGELPRFDYQKVNEVLWRADAVLALVGEWAKTNLARVTASGRTLETWKAELAPYMELLRSALDIISAGLSMDPSKFQAVNASKIAEVLGGATEALKQVEHEAAAWAKYVRSGGRDLASVSADAHSFITDATGAVELITKTNELFHSLVDAPVNIDLRAVIANVKTNIVTAIQALATAWGEIEVEGGEIAKATAVAVAASPVAEAISSIMDAMSLDAILANPLMNMKTNRAGNIRTRYNKAQLDKLVTDIVDGMKRTLKALVDGLSGVSIPKDLGANLDPLLDVWDRIAALLERVRELTAPDPEKIRQIAAAAAALAAAISLAGTAGAGAGGGGAVAAAQSWGEAPTSGPTAGYADLMRGATTANPYAGVTVGGDTLRGQTFSPTTPPVLPTPPGGGVGGGATMNADMKITIPVLLDGEILGQAMERTLTQRNLRIELNPQGS